MIALHMHAGSVKKGSENAARLILVPVVCHGNVDFITAPLTVPPTDSHQLLQPLVTATSHFINKVIIPDNAYQDWIDAEHECECEGLLGKSFLKSVKDLMTFLASGRMCLLRVFLMV